MTRYFIPVWDSKNQQTDFLEFEDMHLKPPRFSLPKQEARIMPFPKKTDDYEDEFTSLARRVAIFGLAFLGGSLLAGAKGAGVVCAWGAIYLFVIHVSKRYTGTH